MTQEEKIREHGGVDEEILYADFLDLDKDKVAKAKYLIQYNRGIYTVIDNKTKEAITSFPTQLSAVNYIKNKYSNGTGYIA